jgi:dephospho-CoA kinase
MKTIGLTGGIGSGKSVVARLLETMGFPVYDSDREAKRITTDSDTVREQLTKQFGQEIYKKNELNRNLLASLIFDNEKNRNFVSSIIHPEVRKDFIRWREQRQDSDFAIIESAILFESGFDKEVDICVLVMAPMDIRIERVQKRDKTNRESVLKRIQNQTPDEEKREKSDYIIINDNQKAILPQIEDMLYCLKLC